MSQGRYRVKSEFAPPRSDTRLPNLLEIAPEHSQLAQSRYRAALVHYAESLSRAILNRIERPIDLITETRDSNADKILNLLDGPAGERAFQALSQPARLVLGFFDLLDLHALPLLAIQQTLKLLGEDPLAPVREALESGLLVIEADPAWPGIEDIGRVLTFTGASTLRLRVHPSLARISRTELPTGPGPATIESVTLVQESDGLESIVHLAALWQRALESPFRQTQTGSLYKRDRERLAEDSVFSGAGSVALAPLHDPPAFWLALALRVGLLDVQSGIEQLSTSGFEFWDSNAVHLPRMIAAGWLGLEGWNEREADDPGRHPIPWRLAALLWLATLPEGQWTTLDELANRLGTPLETARDAASQPRKAKLRPRPGSDSDSDPRARLEAILLGPAYLLGLVRVAAEQAANRRAIQLAPLGRYLLSVGPAPTPQPPFEQFLFVQPNLEVIAYRQGLAPRIIGRLSHFARWTKVGSAFELALSRESVTLGLDQGETAASILEMLRRHSHRALPSSVTEAIPGWASRREQFTLYESATLIEFPTTADRDRAAREWSAPNLPAPVPVADRFLLVEDERVIPFDRLRLTSTRDYAQPSGTCVAIDHDGLAMTVDPTRSDLLAEIEIRRFAEPEPRAGAQDGAPRFVVTRDSIRRALERGISQEVITRWYERRTDAPAPPAVGLLFAGLGPAPPVVRCERKLILELPSREILDGLYQHPATGGLLGDRLGPRTATIAEDQLPTLRAALTDLGLATLIH